MQRVGHGLKWLPGLAVGLFVSRLAAESLAPASWWQVLLLTAVFTLPLAWLLARLPLAHTWPALLLTPYLFYPEPDPRIAALMAAAAGITALLLSRPAARPCQRPYLVAAGIALAFFLLYWQTLAPGLLPADSGEFQVVAANLGVAHPPGFPLYTLLGHLMTRLPLPGTAAYQVNLLSAITSSLTLAFVYLTAHHLTQRTLPGLTAVLALGTATTFWSQATGANVRSLTGLFAALMLYALVRWQAARRAAPQSDRWLVLFALALGFGLTHHVSLLFMACIFGLFIFWNDPTLLRQPHRWLRPFLAAAAGLLPLLYLPLRATADARGASLALATLNGFLDHVLARGFSGDFFYFIAPADLWARLRVMGNVMTFQFHPWLLAGMAAGLVVLLRRDRRLAFLLGGAWLLHTLITATYRAPQTVEYMLPAYVPAALLLAYAVAAGQQALHGRFRAVAAPLLAITLLAAARQGVRHYDSFAWLSRSTDTRDNAQTLLDQAPANTLLLADWHWATPLWYLQEVENRRPDVTVRFVFPEAAPYAETWATRIAAALAAGETVLATHYDADAYAALPPAEPLGDAFLYRQSPLRQLPPAFTALDVTLGDTLRLTGYHLATAALPAGQEARLTLAWQATTAPPANLTLFAHLVGPDGRLYAQQDVRVLPQPAGLTLTQFRLPPRPGALPGAYQILVGAYAAAPLPTPAGDARLPIASLTVTATPQPPLTQNPVYRTLLAERPFRRLVGYDWDNTLPEQPRLYLHWQTAAGYHTETHDAAAAAALALPAYAGAWGLPRTTWRGLDNPGNTHYVPLGHGIIWLGSGKFEMPETRTVLPLAQQFRSSRVINRDLVVSVRLIGYEADGVHWAWWDLDDGVPAMGAIPTLKWIRGSAVRDPHWLAVPETAVAGQPLGALLRLYDAFTGQTVPILDERITQNYLGIPLGSSTTPPN